MLASLCVLAATASLQLGWRAGTPEPVLDADPGFLELYWKAWENYQAAVVQDARPALFPPRFVAPGGRVAFDEATTYPIFSRWAWRATPTSATLDLALTSMAHAGSASEAILASDGSSVGEATGPPLLGLCIWSLYELTGDRRLLETRFSPAVRRHGYLLSVYEPEEGRRFVPAPFSVLPGPRGPQPQVSAEATGLLLQDAEFLRRCAAELKVVRSERLFRQTVESEVRRLKELWHEETSSFRGRDEEGEPLEHPSLPCMWALIGGRFQADFARRATSPLADTERFARLLSYPSLPKSDPAYDPASGVFPLHQYLTLRALIDNGMRNAAGYAAENMLRGYLRAAGEDLALYSEYGPDTRAAAPTAIPGSTDAGFVAIAGLIEALLGFRVSAAEGEVRWNIWRRDRHGLKGLRFADNTVSLVAGERSSRAGATVIDVECERPFTLVVTIGGGTWQKRFQAGKHVWKTG